jgi:hypothetical protein
MESTVKFSKSNTEGKVQYHAFENQINQRIENVQDNS